MPRWSRDGRELFYENDQKIMAVTIQEGTKGLEAGPPVELFEMRNLLFFEPVPDSDDFIAVVEVPGTGIMTKLHLVQNWFEELERLVPVPDR